MRWGEVPSGEGGEEEGLFDDDAVKDLVSRHSIGGR